MNYLTNFGVGWQTRLNARIQSLQNIFPNVPIVEIRRTYGMLDVIADTAEVNEDIRYIYSATCVAIRRDSAKVCEACGKGAKIRGKQTDIYVLPEQKCLCSKCYALEIDTVETQKLK